MDTLLFESLLHQANQSVVAGFRKVGFARAGSVVLETIESMGVARILAQKSHAPYRDIAKFLNCTDLYMAEREGFETLRGIDNTQLIDSTIRSFSKMLSFEGFAVQNRVQGRKGERTPDHLNVWVIFWRA